MLAWRRIDHPSSPGGTPASNPTHLSRRTLAKGAAWAVPVVAVAAAAPAMAASGGAPSFVFEGACKFSGQSCSIAPWGYALGYRVTNTSQKTIYVCTPTITIDPPSPFASPLAPVPFPGGCQEIGPGQSGVLLFYAKNPNGNSGNLTFSGPLSIPCGHTCPCAGDPAHHPNIVARFTVGGTPPHGLCDCGAPWIPA